eukprot:CAMPEP_0167828162 /NCGR_PEP_ID=MMETSP0112_2-20121227/11213_1 /TAXON_ID=91324 /ORGANISM="Lotharella globosa, Strain CCCM811" /LENGTH=72 /DNA_ID=CAMNT_0007731239 /DNA_START=31 /DNA_END=252 /DNA_ORIENTATION=+
MKSAHGETNSPDKTRYGFVTPHRCVLLSIRFGHVHVHTHTHVVAMLSAHEEGRGWGWQCISALGVGRRGEME